MSVRCSGAASLKCHGEAVTRVCENALRAPVARALPLSLRDTKPKGRPICATAETGKCFFAGTIAVTPGVLVDMKSLASRSDEGSPEPVLANLLARQSLLVGVRVPPKSVGQLQTLAPVAARHQTKECPRHTEGNSVLTYNPGRPALSAEPRPKRSSEADRLVWPYRCGPTSEDRT